MTPPRTGVQPADHAITSIVINYEFFDVRRHGEERRRTVPGPMSATVEGCCDTVSPEEVVAAVIEAPELRHYRIPRFVAQITPGANPHGWPATFTAQLALLPKGDR